MRIGRVREQDQGFVMNHSVTDHAPPTKLEEQQAAQLAS